MSVKIHIDLNLAIVHLLFNRFLHSPDRWLISRARINVIAIQVLRHGVKPVVTSIDAIRVQHWHNLEDIFVSEDL